MGMNNANITITADNRQAIKQTDEVTQSIKKLDKSVKQSNGSVKDFTKSWVNNSISLNSTLEILNKGIGIFRSSFEEFKKAAQLEEVALYTKNAAESIGINFKNLENASKIGANGMTDNLTIMKANLKALKGGLKASAEEFGELWQIADASSDELGQSIEQTFEQITKAINTGNSKSLISMGLLSESFTEAKDKSELLSKRGEVLKEVLSQLGPKAEELGKYGETAADKFTKLETSFSNLKTEIATKFLPTGFVFRVSVASEFLPKHIRHIKAALLKTNRICIDKISKKTDREDNKPSGSTSLWDAAKWAAVDQSGLNDSDVPSEYFTK